MNKNLNFSILNCAATDGRLINLDRQFLPVFINKKYDENENDNNENYSDMLSILKLIFHYSHILRYPIFNINQTKKYDFSNFEIYLADQNLFLSKIFQITPTEKSCKELFGYFGLNGINFTNYLGLDIDKIKLECFNSIFDLNRPDLIFNILEKRITM
jgi:hypothetical protein